MIYGLAGYPGQPIGQAGVHLEAVLLVLSVRSEIQAKHLPLSYDRQTTESASGSVGARRPLVSDTTYLPDWAPDQLPLNGFAFEEASRSRRPSSMQPENCRAELSIGSPPSAAASLYLADRAGSDWSIHD